MPEHKLALRLYDESQFTVKCALLPVSRGFDEPANTVRQEESSKIQAMPGNESGPQFASRMGPPATRFSFHFTQRCWNCREQGERTAFVSDWSLARLVGLIQAME